MLRLCAAAGVLLMALANAVTAADEAAPKPATEATRGANAAAAQSLPFEDTRDFAEAHRGFIAPLPHDGIVKDDKGNVVWDPSPYRFIQEGEPCPDTIHPSLWRQAQLVAIRGLFQVTDRIYQVRGYDLSNITFIEGDTGITVIDPLICAETARASLDLYFTHRPRKPVVAVIYSHSHIDHFGGVRGVVDRADYDAGKVRIIAPEGFLEEAISENVLAGNVMIRRASYMYGVLIPKDPTGQVTSGLALTTSNGTVTLLPPTETITQTGTKLSIDGLTYEFQLAPGTEAPSEMHFYIDELQALCPAENATHTLHNLYTPRGAKTRDAKAWAYYLTQLLELYGDKAEVMYIPHHWPLWGRERIREHITKMRDTFKYIHDQSLRLANTGYTMVEVAELLRLPPELEANWSSHGYYGSVNHNSKAVYNFYLGWFDGNPSTLHPLPPVEASKHYLEFMGGADAVLAKARQTFDQGEYRWTAQVLNHVVLAEPENAAGRQLLADTLEQLGYQSENATWRNFYLSGALELRRGVVPAGPERARSPDIVAAMPLEMFFDYLAVRINATKAAGKRISVNFNFPDVRQQYALRLENSVLSYTANKQDDKADCTVTLSRERLNRIMQGLTTIQRETLSGKIRITGDVRAVQGLFGLMDTFRLWFNLVTPNPPSAE